MSMKLTRNITKTDEILIEISGKEMEVMVWEHVVKEIMARYGDKVVVPKLEEMRLQSMMSWANVGDGDEAPEVDVIWKTTTPLE